MASNANLFEDFSGVSSTSTDPNPYNALIEACNNDPAKIRSRYAIHRETRAAKQRELLLSDTFEGVNPDPILRSLLIEKDLPQDHKTGYVDPRNCLVIWVRPPERIRCLIQQVQTKLKEVVPNMWFMPPQNLHLTALEVTNSLTPTELDSFASKFEPLVDEATQLVSQVAKDGKLAGLEQPMLTFDASAVALSFLPYVPGSGDGEQNGTLVKRDSTYTYHHLRRDLWDLCSSTSVQNGGSSTVSVGAIPNHPEGRGVPVSSRYVVPSIHLTIGRFVSRADTSTIAFTSLRDDEMKNAGVDREKMKQFVAKIDEINEWLGEQFGGNSTNDGRGMNPGQWIAGEEIGPDCHRGRLWYGGGERIRVGSKIAV